jgi:hypothetical protein
LDVSYETVRRWVLKFGPQFARDLQHRRPRPTSQWHLDEMAVMIAGKQFRLWRAVDDEGEASRPARATTARQGGGGEADAQTAQEARLPAYLASD